MPVEDLMNISEDDLVLAFHARWHGDLLVLYHLHVALHSQVTKLFLNDARFLAIAHNSSSCIFSEVSILFIFLC